MVPFTLKNVLAVGQEDAEPRDAGNRLNKQCIVFMLFVAWIMAELGVALK